MTFIINASGLFRAAWALVKGFLDPRTVLKIEIKGEDYKQDLLKHV